MSDPVTPNSAGNLGGHVMRCVDDLSMSSHITNAAHTEAAVFCGVPCTLEFSALLSVGSGTLKIKTASTRTGALDFTTPDDSQAASTTVRGCAVAASTVAKPWVGVQLLDGGNMAGSTFAEGLLKDLIYRNAGETAVSVESAQNMAAAAGDGAFNRSAHLS